MSNTKTNIKNNKTTMNNHYKPTTLRLIKVDVYPVGPAAHLPSDRTKTRKSACTLTTLLDRTIALLMTAIVLTLAWPVGMAVWGQSRAHGDDERVCQSVYDAPLPANHRSANSLARRAT